MKKTISLVISIILLSTIATATPIAWFPFDGSYNNCGSTGGTLTTNVNITTNDKAKGSGSLNMSGISGLLIPTASIALNQIPIDITITQWAKIETKGTTLSGIFEATWGSDGLLIGYDATADAYISSFYNGDISISYNTPDYNWHFFVITYEASTQNLSLYVDGTLIDTQIETSPPTFSNISYTSNTISGGDDNTILVDEPKLYDYVLTIQQMSDSMNETCVLPFFDWLFNDTYSDTTDTYTFEVNGGSSFTNITGVLNDGVINPDLQLNTSFGNNGHYAFCLWNKPLAWGGASISLFDSNEDTQTNIQNNGDLNGGIWFVRTTAGIISDIIQNNSPSLNRWHSYCISYNTTSDILTGYIDGNDAGSITSGGTGVVNKDDLFQFYQPSGTIGAIRYYNYTPSLSEIAQWHNETYIYEAQACSNDNDCGTCEFCSGGGCYFQSNTDYKNECGTDVTGCGIASNGAWYRQDTGLCAGAGVCDNIPVPVSSGNVCLDLNNEDVYPNALVNCGIWSNCTINGTIAPEFYVGFTNDFSQQCNPINAVITGTNQTASFGYQFNITGFYNTCSESIIDINAPVIQNITTGEGSAPSQASITPINGIIDLNNVTTLAVIAPSVGITVDFTGASINFNTLDTTAIVITENSVSIDTILEPQLNVPTTLTFYNIGPGAVILRNGQPCGSYCSNIQQVGTTLTVDVSGFSTYTVSEEAAQGCENTRNTVFAAFALIAVSIIITVAFLLIKFGDSFGAYMAAAITTIGLAIVLFVGYYIITAVQYAICVV